MKTLRLTGASGALLLITVGCSEEPQVVEKEPPPPPTYTYAEAQQPAPDLERPLLRVEQGADLGIDFLHETGAAGDKLMPETMGPGCALFDQDGDGRLDVLLVDGRPWTDAGPRPLARLYRNQGERFREVTDAVGLDAVAGYGMGVAVADYDGDGDPDLALTTVTGPRLLRNDAGQYVEVTAAAGLEIAAPEWATSAAWLDADRDGWLDLFVANYVRWSPGTDIFTTLDGSSKSYATPQVYEGLYNRLFRNLGDGRFADVTAKAGLASGENKALGVVALDVNHDGFTDLFVSNDTVANKLYVNDGRGGFIDRALEAGVGYDEMGQARAGMGVDAGESVDGAPLITVGNFSNESVSLYERLDKGEVFVDAAQKRGLATQTLPRLTFGARFADLDQDGRDDLILANGHIEPEIQKVQNAVAYRQPIDVFMAQAGGRFTSLAELTGQPVSGPVVGRCLAVGDIDGDGDLDALVSANGGPVMILRNATGGKRAVLVDLRDPDGGNTQALGAEVTLSAPGWSRRETVRARGSYLGHSPYTLHFAVPTVAGDEVQMRVRWPDGAEQARGALRVGGRYRIDRRGEMIAIGSPQL